LLGIQVEGEGKGVYKSIRGYKGDKREARGDEEI
jgi:hypothetical protein